MSGYYVEYVMYFHFNTLVAAKYIHIYLHLPPTDRNTEYKLMHADILLLYSNKH